jgi:phenylalanyl-tRNA synthetase beta chain
MLDVVRRNMDQGIKRLKIFQCGRIFLSPEGPNKLPDEVTTLSMVWTSPPGSDFWNDLKGSTNLFDIKREVEIMLQTFRIDLGPDLCYNFDESTGVFTYSAKDGILIEGGIIPEPLGERYDFDQPVWYVNGDLVKLYDLRSARPKLKPLPQYPVSKRDLSLIAGEGVPFIEIEKSLARHGGRLLESLQVFDVYRGDSIAAGRTAYGVRLHFRSPARTLTDGEIDQIIDKIVTKLKNELNVELRN